MELLPTIWFIAIAVLWTGYLFLEGFDLGVGMLMRLFARNNTERRVLLNTIGPVWDGNEVWLLTAGGATFAAFPLWYASLFSALYLPLLVVEVKLLVKYIRGGIVSAMPELAHSPVDENGDATPGGKGGPGPGKPADDVLAFAY